MPYPLVARIISEAASALDYAHGATSADGTPMNVIHRDVSPQNILVSSAGLVKLIDFGVAKADTASQRTRTGFIKGKFAYMSPEQILGEKLDRRSDVFALGLVIYELLCHRTAAIDESETAVMEKILNVRFEPVERYRRDLPRPLGEVLARLLRRSSSSFLTAQR